MNRPLNPWKLTGYKAGQSMICKIVAAEPGGYSVVLVKDNLPGFLPTQEQLSPGQEVLAEFVCVHSNRILLSSRFAGGSTVSVTQAPPPVQPTQKSPAAVNRADAAFALWAQSPTSPHIKLRSATDLLIPPVDSSESNTFLMKEYNLEWLITNLEGGMRTGCVKASSQERLSRSAMLLYRGRVVGCIYGAKRISDSFSLEMSLSMMLADITLPETQVTVYDLPEEIVLSMSALFLGYPVNRSDDLDIRSYMDYLCNWFEQKEQTACMAFSLPKRSATCLALIHKGKYVGSFYVEDQTFNRDKSYIYHLLEEEPESSVQSSILPPEMISTTVRFGFSLSVASER